MLCAGKGPWPARFLKISFISVILCGGLPLLSNASGTTRGLGPRVNLKDIAIAKTAAGLEVRIVLEAEVSPNKFELTEPSRLVLDFEGARLSTARREICVSEFGISRVRAGMFATDTARIVFDAEGGRVPDHEISRTPDGWKILFLADKARAEGGDRSGASGTAGTAAALAEEMKTAAAPKAIDRPGQTETKEMSGAGKASASVEKPGAQDAALKKQLDEVQNKLDETIKILNDLKARDLARKKKFLRVTATGDYFSPRDGLLESVYRHGLDFGAEVDLGVADFVEVWAAEHYFGKTLIEAETGAAREVSLIPFEAGLKIRMNKGILNPYLGLGGGYFQYREKSSLGLVREKRFGVVGQAGVFVKISGVFVIDFFAHYKSCPIETAGRTFNVGGLHTGLGFGAEF